MVNFYVIQNPKYEIESASQIEGLSRTSYDALFNYESPEIPSLPPELPPPTSEESLDSKIQDTQSASQDIATFVTQDKLKIHHATTQLLTHLISSRSQIKENNIARLDYKIVQCEGYLLNLDSWPPFSNSMVEAKRANLGHAINKLESEKNQEETRCWTDKARLYQELAKALGEYQLASRRSLMLSGEPK